MSKPSKLTLAITKIGDLLLRKTISTDSEGHQIENIALDIPDYQRPYKWTARNAMQLLDDIVEARNSNKERYRVGTLILHHDAEANRYYIVDGQQRTITFALLLRALYELLDRECNIDFLHKSVFDNQYSRHNIPNNFNTFKRRLKSDSADDRANDKVYWENMRSFIETQCELIVVITPDLSEAFQFFDSQNARGRELYPHDLLKASHLREMSDVSENETEQIVKAWEVIPQQELSELFGQVLYYIKEWANGNRVTKLDERTIHKFKGITKSARSPYAQYYKSAYAYSRYVCSSAMPFVAGSREITPFQLNAPIIAGRPFFEYTQHYFAILKDIRDNSKFVGFYVQDNEIVKTLDRHIRWGKGNSIARLLFDTSLLFYVDRFCPATHPSREDVNLFDKFLTYAFVWAYSLRAQYSHLGWDSAQNYVLESPRKGIRNAINIYKMISEADSPTSLISALDDRLVPLSAVSFGTLENLDNIEDGVYTNYLHFFAANGYPIK